MKSREREGRSAHAADAGRHIGLAGTLPAEQGSPGRVGGRRAPRLDLRPARCRSQPPRPRPGRAGHRPWRRGRGLSLQHAGLCLHHAGGRAPGRHLQPHQLPAGGAGAGLHPQGRRSARPCVRARGRRGGRTRPGPAQGRRRRHWRRHRALDLCRRCPGRPAAGLGHAAPVRPGQGPQQRAAPGPCARERPLHPHVHQRHHGPAQGRAAYAPQQAGAQRPHASDHAVHARRRGPGHGAAQPHGRAAHQLSAAPAGRRHTGAAAPLRRGRGLAPDPRRARELLLRGAHHGHHAAGRPHRLA